MARFITNNDTSKSTPTFDGVITPASSASAVSAFKAFHIDGNLFLPLNERVLLDDYRNHNRMMLKSGYDYFSVSPMTYLKIDSGNSASNSHNSSLNTLASARQYYEKIEGQLLALAHSDDEDDVVEEGALDTARSVLGQLRAAQFAPPALSWHGGDAVVMLWAIGGTTYAITVTDGEVGYVVRRNKKELRSQDSIALDSFRLEDLT